MISLPPVSALYSARSLARGCAVATFHLPRVRSGSPLLSFRVVVVVEVATAAAAAGGEEEKSYLEERAPNLRNLGCMRKGRERAAAPDLFGGISGW